MSRQPASQIEWCKHARKAGFDVHRLARHLEVTVRTLQRWWRLANHGPLEVWLQVQRAYWAIPLLELFGSSKVAAALSGYSNEAVFCRQFKRCHGVTAGAYIARFKLRSPWWLEAEMLPVLELLQSDCRRELERRR